MRIAGENLKIQANGLQVNYDDNGPVYAPAVVFVHGTPFNKSFWDLQAEALKSNYRVISYDLRGHGKTTGGEDSVFSIELFTEDLVRFMDALEVEKAILCGGDLGGYIALKAIDKHPDRFNALVLSGVQCMEDSHEVREERDRMLQLLKDSGIDKYAEELMKSVFAPNSFITRKEEVRSVRNMIYGTDPTSIEKTLDALSKRRESCSNLWAFDMPTLIMAGREDALTPLSVARFMQDNISGSVLHEIEYAGHLANLENTHEFNLQFKAFVENVCQKKHLSKHCTDAATLRGLRRQQLDF